MLPRRLSGSRVEILLGIGIVALLLVPARTLTQSRGTAVSSSMRKGGLAVSQTGPRGWSEADSSNVQPVNSSATSEVPLAMATGLSARAAPRAPTSGSRRRLPSPSSDQFRLAQMVGGSFAVPTSGSLDFNAWLAEMDTNQDGQISLSEWRIAGRPVSQFQRMDRNQDGFLTADEASFFAAGQSSRRSSAQESQVHSSTDMQGEPKDSSEGSASSSASSALMGGLGRLARSQQAAKPATAASTPSPTTKKGPTASSKSSAAKSSITKAVHSAQAAAAPVRPAVTSPPPSPYPDSTATQAISIPGSNNTYWITRNQQNETLLAAGDHPSILFLGDSITEWLEYETGKPLWNEYLAPLGAADFAMGGLTTAQVLWQVESGQVAAAAPAVTVLMIGTNNLAYGQSPPAVADGITKIVQEIHAQLPRTRILLLGILPRGQSPADPYRAKIAQVNALISGLADGKQVYYLDIGAGFLQADGSISPQVLPDYVHPSLLGYEIYLASVWQTLLKLLEN